MNYYLFIDESGDHGLVNIDPNFPVFVLCGVIFSESDFMDFEKNILVFKNKYWKGKKVILHSRNIRKCEFEFSILLEESVKRDFYLSLNEIISQSTYSIISSAINKEKHIKTYGKLAQDVYQIALSIIVERAIFYLDSIKEDNKKLTIIIEKRGSKEDKELSIYFQKIISRGTAYVSSARLKAYAIGINFHNKKDDISGLQLSDLVAYPIARYVIDPKRANPAYDIVAEKFYRYGGKVYGLKIFP